MTRYSTTNDVTFDYEKYRELNLPIGYQPCHKFISGLSIPMYGHLVLPHLKRDRSSSTSLSDEPPRKVAAAYSVLTPTDPDFPDVLSTGNDGAAWLLESCFS